MILGQLVLAFFGIGEMIIASLIIGAITGGTTAVVANQQKKSAEGQAGKARRQQAKEAAEMNKLIEESKPLAPPKNTQAAFQSTPRSATRTGTVRDLNIRRKTGKSALRVPKSGSGLRIPY